MDYFKLGDTVPYYYKGDVAVRYEVMQYTGLKDKNGKEVWQDDILKYKDGSREAVLRVMLQPGGFVMIEKKQINSDFPIWEDMSNLQTQGVIRQSCEVIGNIYEHPDLF